MEQDSTTTVSSALAGEWRRVIDPPERGEVVWTVDWDSARMVPEKATLVSTGHDIWVSEDTGHIVYPTHWRPLEDGNR